MLLAIDIGNSSIKFGAFQGKKLLHNFSLKSSSEISSQEYFLKIQKSLQEKSITFSKAIICSVVNDLTDIVSQSIKKLFPSNIIIIDQRSQIKLPIKIANKVARNEVGKDRLITSMAAMKKFGKNLAVVDLGTATTIDIIDKKGFYQGGAIFAGIDLTLKTLAQSTSLLPKVKFQKQGNIIGKNTVEAINSGIYFGHAFMVENMVQKMSKEHGEKLKIILTGGYAEIIQELIPDTTVQQHLALYGIAALLLPS
jgi:type III pantothenate kinase